MSEDSDSAATNWFRRRLLQTSAAGLVTGAGIGVGSTSVAAQENETETGEEEEEEQEEEEEEQEEEEQEEEEETEDDETNEESTTCDGSPSMSRTSVTTPNSRITTDDPAVVEANFRPDQMIPDECTIIVDLEFSFSDPGFQWGGGAEWDQATSDLVVGTFEVRPGEIRDIRAEIHTQGAEAGDSVTVVADYELWFEGNPEGSVQQSGIRNTIDVEEPNPPGEDQEASVTDTVPGFGISSAVAAVGGAAYVLKSKLTGKNE